MNRLIIVIAVFLTTVSCTSITVNKVDSSKHQISLICIKKNPKVIVKDFLGAVEDLIRSHGIETEIYDESAPAHCRYILKYTARQEWDVTLYLISAELVLMHNDKTIGSASYRNSGGLALTKYASAKSKLAPVIDKLLSEF